MFTEQTATLLIAFCVSFIGLCFALNKNCMKTQSSVTRYAAPPRNSSITFLVFYLCKQKSSSNQRGSNCLESAVSISVNWSFFPNAVQVQTLPQKAWDCFFFFFFSPSCFLKSHIGVSAFLKFIQSRIMKFLKASQWVHKKMSFSEFYAFTERLPSATDPARTFIFLLSRQHCEINASSAILERLSFRGGKLSA